MPNNTPDTLTPEWLERAGFENKNSGTFQHSNWSLWVLKIPSQDGSSSHRIRCIQWSDGSASIDVTVEPPTPAHVVRLLAALGVEIEGEGT